jgi:methanogenic corrinoid protein MtbC1
MQEALEEFKHREGSRMIDYALMNQCLYEGKAGEVEAMTREALAEGRAVQEVLTEGLIAGMSVVGEDFKHNILYVPEVLIAARAMKAGMAVLKPLLTAREGRRAARRRAAHGYRPRRPARHRQESRLHDG